MKQRLVIISDLFGFNNCSWIQFYVSKLEPKFDITLYDVHELGEIENKDLSEDELHNQFLKDRLEIAVNNLLKLEKDPVNILAVSIGGTIAWKAALKGLQIKKLVAVSSTRIRKETVKPNCELDLIFGEKDSFAPSNDWFKTMELNYTRIKNISHTFYKEIEHVDLIVNHLK